jgi:hypothetical protein
MSHTGAPVAFIATTVLVWWMMMVNSNDDNDNILRVIIMIEGLIRLVIINDQSRLFRSLTIPTSTRLYEISTSWKAFSIFSRHQQHLSTCTYFLAMNIRTSKKLELVLVFVTPFPFCILIGVFAMNISTAFLLTNSDDTVFHCHLLPHKRFLEL